MTTTQVLRPDVPSASRRHEGIRTYIFVVYTASTKETRMTYAVVVASALLAVLLTLAWAKEFRLRRALQTLLARIFTHWRPARETKPTNQPHADQRSHVDPADNDRVWPRT